jgi:hypothetical protein
VSFALPWVFAMGVATAVGVVALHLLSTRRPPLRPLPTARFVPESDLRAVSRTSRPTDLLLLALRVLAVLLIAAAFAKPIPDAPGPAVRRVVALEWTTALVDAEAARTRALSLIAEGDALVVYDTAARVLPATALASLGAPTVRRAALSPMLVALRDAATEIARGADSIAVTVLGGFPSDAWDAATDTLRATWPGRLDLERLPTADDALVAQRVVVLPDDADDPVVAGVATLRAASGTGEASGGAASDGGARAHQLRIRRTAMAAEDSAWLANTPGGTLMLWPRDSAAALAADGVLASLGADAALVAPLARLAPDVAADDPGVRVIARWRDGSPAATERAMGPGCVRHVAVGLPERGDLTLREPFLRWLSVMLEPCGGQRTPSPTDSAMARFAGGAALAAAAPFERDADTSPLTPWLLLAAVVLLGAEQVLRRAPSSEAAA